MVVAAALGWVLLAMAAASLVSRELSVANQPVIIVATFAPYFVLPSIAGTVVLAVVGSLVGVLAGVVLTIAVIIATVRTRIRIRRPAGSTHVLSIMTNNKFLGRGDPVCILEIARRERVDVLALQEVTPESVEALRAAGIDAEFPYAVLAPAALWEGVALWSKHPLRDIRTDIHGGLHRVEAVVQLDPERPDMDPVAISLHIAAPWPENPRPWLSQLHDLSVDLAGRTRPTIAMGDYNATLSHKPFRQLLTAGFNDAAVTARSWLGFTYPARFWSPPLIAIDHVVSRGLHATRLRTARIADSDHLALIADLGRYPT